MRTSLLLIASAALATPALAIDSSQNAALRYYRAWTLFSVEDRSAITEAARVLFHDEWAPPESIDLAWFDQAPATLILEASAIEEIDFAIDFSKGVYAEIPHLSAMRDSARAMAIGARLKLDAGDVDGAVELIAAGYRIGEHSAQDRVLISSLVAAANFHAADLVAEYADSLGVLTPTHRRHLALTLARFDARDPFAIKAAIEREREMTMTWIEHQLELGNRDVVLALIPHVSDDDSAPFAAAVQHALEQNDNLQPELRLVNVYYNQALAAWDAPNAPARLHELAITLKEGGFGPLAALFAADLVRVYEHAQRAHADFHTAVLRFTEE